MLRPIFEHTDIERYTILKKCDDLIFSDTEMESEFDDHLLQRAAKYFDIFDKIRAYDEFIKEEEKQKNEEFLKLFNKASIFIKHYFQTISMSIERGELPKNVAESYGLNYPFDIPKIKSDVQLLSVAEKLFEDDLRRTTAGGKYFTNPSIGAVKVWVEKFAEAVRVKNNTYNVKQAEVENIDGIRTDTDNLLTDVYYVVLAKIESEPTVEKLKMLKACGFNSDCDEEIKVAENSEPEVVVVDATPGQLRFDL